MAETIKGINVVIGAETTGLTKALSEVNKQSRNMQTELKQVDKLLKLDPKNTELLAQKQELLSKAVQTTKEKLDTLKTAQSQVNEQFAKGEINEGQYRAFQRELAATEQKLNELEKAIGPVKKSLEEIGTAMEKSGKKISETGTSLTKNVTAPIVAFGVAAGAASIQFESAFAGVVKTVDATEEELASLRQGIRDMAKDIPVAATDIAEVAEAAGQLGIEVPNIMLFTRTMSDLGVATNMGSSEAAEALARLANITSMNQQDFDKLGSSIVALGNNFATTESDIVSMSLRLAGAGSQIGMSEADIMGLAAALSSVGIEAEMGGSALSRVMVRMQVASTTGLGKVKELTDQTGISLRDMQLMAANAGMDFADLSQSLGMTKNELKAVVNAGVDLENFAAVAGMTAEQFTEKFAGDAVGALGEFINGLGNAEEAGDSAINMLQEMGITEIRLRDSLLRAGNASELFANAIDLSNTAWDENNALTKEAETRYGTTESQLKILWNQIKDIAITLGDVLVPAMMDAIEAFKPMINIIADLAKWFSNLDPSTQQLIITIVSLVAALGPALIMVGKVVTSVGDMVKTFAVLKKAIQKAGGVMTLLTGPVGITIAVIAALAAAAYLIIKNWEPISKFFSDLWNGIVDVTVSVWESIKSFFSATWEWIKGFFAEWGPLILSSIAPFLGIPLLIYQHWDTISEFLSNLWDGIIGYLSGVWDNIKKTASGAFQGMVNLVKPIIDGFKTYFTGIWEVIKNIFAGALLLIIDLVTGDFENLRKDAEAIWNNLKAAFKMIWDGIKQIFSGTLEVIKTVISSAWTSIKTNVSSAWDGIKSVISTVITAIMTYIKNRWNDLITFFKEFPAKLYNIGTEMFNRMKDAVTTTVQGVKDAIVNGITDAINWIKNLPDQMVQMGKDIINGLINGISSTIDKVKDTVKKIADTVTGGIRDFLGINSPSKVLMEIGEWTGEGFAIGIADSVDEVKRQTAAMAASAIPDVKQTQTSATSPSYNFEGFMSGAVFNVRNENDIKAIAREIFILQQNAMRGAGIN